MSRYKFFAGLLLFTVLFSGCKPETCPVSCGTYVGIVAVGFTLAELNNTVERNYENNGAFNLLEDTLILSLPNYWSYPTPNDTTSDTLILASNYCIGINFDCEFFIPVASTDYKISNIVTGGTLVDNYSCFEGGRLTGGNNCLPAAYLRSYTINGKQVTISGNNGNDSLGNDYGAAGFIYLVK